MAGYARRILASGYSDAKKARLLWETCLFIFDRPVSDSRPAPDAPETAPERTPP